jgi:phosphatidylserine/phosphatidylglycerophosphate/cardiolipin synthase-like enzyme
MNIDSVSDTVDLLADAEARGVDVRVLLEKSSFDEGLNGMNANARSYLGARNVEARFDGANTITHAKVVLADDSVVIGTNNWGYGGFEDNHEAGVITTDPATVGKIASYFEGLWVSATP